MSEAQQTSDYPGALDTFVTLTDKEDLAEVSDINKIKAAVVATQTELGTDVAGTVATLKLRLAAALAGNGAIANGTAFPTSPAPVDGQIFYRTDENTVYIYNGSAWESVAMAHVQIFTTSGTFTAPGGITKVYLSMVGGGGGGGAQATSRGGGGGGGGAYIINYPFTVISGNNYTVTIGAGGIGGAPSSNGGTGGTTSFDTVNVVGGAGGIGIASGAGGSGSGGLDAGTIPTAGGFTLKGGDGATTSTAPGGGGGGMIFGSGGDGGSGSGVAGTAAGNNTGAGGGGGGTNANSGAGGSGICIVMY